MKSSFFCTLIILSVGVFAQPENYKEQTVLFWVNKRPISAEEFIYLYTKNYNGKKEEFTDQKIEEYIELYIKFKLKVEEARQRGIDKTEKFIKEYDEYKATLRKPYMPDNKLIDSLSVLTYNRLKEEVKAAHILVRLQPNPEPSDTLIAFNKITELKKRIDEGEDFGTLAISSSEDPSAKINEGNLGYFTALQMVYPFETAAYKTPIGKVSNPVRTRFGYHLIKVTDRRPSIGEVEVAHILIRTGKDRDTEKAKKQIDEVYDQLQGGVSWSDLCKQYSEDQSTKDNAGKLRPFGVGAMASLPDFERVAFSLENPGEYSIPFATSYGWHILKLEQKIPLPEYNKIETTLKSRVSRDERIQTAKENIQKSLRKTYNLIENTEIKKQLLSLADSSLILGKWKTPNTELDDHILFSINQKPVKVSAFGLYIEANQKPTKQSPVAYLNQLYENFINKQIEQALEETLLQTNSDYRHLSNEYYEGILLFDIMEKEVWNKAMDDSVGQRTYFNLNKEKYKANERAEAIIYSSAQKTAIDELRQQIENDSVVSEAFLKQKSIRKEQGKYEKDERSVFAKTPWQIGTTNIELEGNHYLVKIEKIIPPGLRLFEESKGMLISDYQNHLEKQWIDELRKKHRVKIDKKGKKYVLSTLQK